MKTGIIKVCLVILIILSFAWIIIMVYANVNLHNDHEQNDPDYSIVPLTDLTIEKPIINLGDVPKDTVIHADFVIRNIGTNNLYITGIDPDCICTDYKISKEIVTPGEQTVIELLVDTRNKFGNNTINVVFKANTERDLYILKLNFNVNTEKEGADSVLLIKNPIVDIAILS